MQDIQLPPAMQEVIARKAIALADTLTEGVNVRLTLRTVGVAIKGGRFVFPALGTKAGGLVG